MLNATRSEDYNDFSFLNVMGWDSSRFPFLCKSDMCNGNKAPVNREFWVQGTAKQEFNIKTLKKIYYTRFVFAMILYLKDRSWKIRNVPKLKVTISRSRSE